MKYFEEITNNPSRLYYLTHVGYIRNDLRVSLVSPMPKFLDSVNIKLIQTTYVPIRYVSDGDYIYHKGLIIKVDKNVRQEITKNNILASVYRIVSISDNSGYEDLIDEMDSNELEEYLEFKKLNHKL